MSRRGPLAKPPPRRVSCLATIGYERASVSAFLSTLKAARITLLLDVRELPLSRRKGFSKRALAQTLHDTGIVYQHERSLGAPRLLRHRLRKDGDFIRYFANFYEYLATQKPLLDHLSVTMTGRVALMCFERDPAECHRSVVVAALAKRLKIDFLHLTVSSDDAEQTSTHSRAHSRQGLPAT
jgi:uncharacterized protein (DUF488 family)